MASSPFPMPKSPRRPGALLIDRYTIRRKLGSGSAGTVYLAEDRRNRRQVALKVLRPDRISALSVARIQKEFQAIASLRHPRIAAAFDFGYTSGGALPYYTREYIEGLPLPPGPPSLTPGATPGRGPAPLAGSPATFLRPMVDLLDALECLHAHDILHLDIHPGNLIVSSDPARGSVLIDFGLPRSLEDSRCSTAPEAITGCPPEMLRGAPLSVATDLFLAGRLLLYRLTGNREGEARLAEIPGWGPRLTLELERIAARALRPDPRQRFHSASEFREAILHAVGESDPASGPIEPGEVTLGREAELGRIGEILSRAAAGEGASLILAGASGSGKSRLLQEARVRAQIQGLEVVLVRFFPETGPGPPLLIALSQAGGGSRKKPRWLETLPAEQGGTPGERAERAAQSFFEEEGKPLLLLLDDFDRADPTSRALAEALIAECAGRRKRGEKGRGLGVVASMTRSERLAGKPVARSLMRLRPLRPAAACDLLHWLVRPLSLPERLARRAAARAEGSPLRLRQIALALSAEWRRAGRIRDDAELPEFPRGTGSEAALSLEGLDRCTQDCLTALALIRRPASSEEIAAAVGKDSAPIAGHLRRLERAELITSGRKGRRRLHQLSRPGIGEVVLRGAPARKSRRMHARLAAFLERRADLDLVACASLARHLLHSGRRSAGRRRALEAAAALRRAGLFDRAVEILEEAIAGETHPRAGFALAEEASAILSEMGSHHHGVAILEPFLKRGGAQPGLPPREALRLRRRLGVHYHRAGFVNEALRSFSEAQRLADPERDRENLVFIDSELAEICTLRGRFGEAEEACRRGLERLSREPAGDFRIRMEVDLRATRGHLELRRLHLSPARRELRAALKLSRRFRMPATCAILFNNLAIAENQLGNSRAAERCFRQAERLLRTAGEKRPVIAIACNLALIAARRGERDEAQGQIERAALLLRRHPGKRLEFLVACARGVVAGILGEAGAALESLPRAIRLGRQLGDRHLVHQAQIYQAEACLASGRYALAQAVLQAAARETVGGPPPIVRSILSRRLLLSMLLGQKRRSILIRRALEAVPRSEVAAFEAWSDLWIGLSRLLAGEPAGSDLTAARKALRTAGAVFGERFALLGLLVDALRRGDRKASAIALKRSAGRVDRREGAHRFLAVAAPLARAQAHFFLGDSHRSRDALSEASAAVVGSPFLDLDWQIELLRARLAAKEGDPAAARGHLQRSLHLRALLLELLPSGTREGFLGHPRFAELDRLAARLEKSPRLFYSTRSLWTPRQRSGLFEGMAGRSKAMVGVFQMIERLRDQELPVLICGETGTGKELVARALHRTGLRAKGPFFALHCASLPVELFESELFGCEAGAFSGAVEARPGLVESLEGGTLLLDEVGELPLAAQPKLLRVLASGRARRLGSVEERDVDVRFIASTSSSLKARVEAGTFREDLFYRLGGMEITVPPLRERREDIGPLAAHFLELYARRQGRRAPTLRDDARRLLEGQRWPGNARQLEGLLLRAMVALSYPAVLTRRDLEPFLGGQGPENAGRAAGPAPLFKDELLDGMSIEELKLELERAYLTRLYQRVAGDLKEMQKVLGVRRSNFYTWLKRVGLDIRDLRSRF